MLTFVRLQLTTISPSANAIIFLADILVAKSSIEIQKSLKLEIPRVATNEKGVKRPIKAILVQT